MPALNSRLAALNPTPCFSFSLSVRVIVRVRRYEQSVFHVTMVGSTVHQAKLTAREARNRFLLEQLKVPPQHWGFKENEWVGPMPVLKLVQTHAGMEMKQRLRQQWREREHNSREQAAASEAEDDDETEAGAAAGAEGGEGCEGSKSTS